jgi:hypothetical protein
MTTAKDVRAQIMAALELDLIGPRTGHPGHAEYAEEVLPIAPSKWYLTGFLVPYEAPQSQRSDEDGQDTVDEVGRSVEADDDTAPEPASARKAFFPSSMGLSVLVSADTSQLRVKLAFADYVQVARASLVTAKESAEESEATPEERAGRGHWRRVPRAAELVLSLAEGAHSPKPVPNCPGLTIVMAVRDVADHGLLPPGTRSVSVFLVNNRPPAPDEQRDAAYVFQPELSILSATPLVARPDLHGQSSEDWDEKVADLQYREVVEYAVGHAVSAMALREAPQVCREVRTAWMPSADVEKVIPRDLGSVELRMESLADAPSAAAVQELVGPLLGAYGDWLFQQAAVGGLDKARQDTAHQLIANARRVHERIVAGLQALGDPLVLEAFRLANRAVAMAMRQRQTHDKPGLSPSSLPPPKWRPFQLAFLLLNLRGTAEPSHADRKVVDLLFFPTGGGKTEAYLGLAAFAMVLRRLRNPTVQSAGVSVLMRYTLRLLTLDQLDRAATMVCALELLRQKDVAKLGTWPFELGLWVGQAATPNEMGRKGDNNRHSARARTLEYLNNTGSRQSPIPLEVCPWCGWKFGKDSFKLIPNSDEPSDLRVICLHRECEFFSRRQARGIPVLTVDEPIYRRLPAFLIATVDKFASLPWVGETAGLFGKVDRHDAEGFYGPARPGRGTPLRGPLSPPDLVIQDELHLISGPLGTMVGLYESAIDALASRKVGGDAPRPKIVASTATVRRAERQIRALFGRSVVEVFPPPGPDLRDSFFAQTAPASQQNPRTYLGIAAPGRNAKVVLLRATLALMAAAQKAWNENGGDKHPDNPADPYMTLLGYFNSLRELGGSRRIVEDEVKARLADYEVRRRRVSDSPTLFANRPRLSEPEELTSRVSTSEVSETKRRLKLSHREKERVDVALATNMISVGLDITRLGLMVVLGQPKTASEYIQATSRVGRDDKRPGLVVTLLNIYRPRDRSHYERFCAWHDSFYRSVEATSVTPFSPRAIDRGIAAVTVALARLGHPGMTAPRQAMAVNKYRAELDFVAEVLAHRAEAHDAQLPGTESEALRQRVRDRVTGLLDAWQSIATDCGELQYARETGTAPPLLWDPLNPDLAKQSQVRRQFTSGRSLRDVEPTVNLWLRSPDGAIVEEESK